MGGTLSDVSIGDLVARLVTLCFKDDEPFVESAGKCKNRHFEMNNSVDA